MSRSPFALPVALIFLSSAQAQEPHSDCGCDIRRGTMCTSMNLNGANIDQAIFLRATAEGCMDCSN